MNLEEYYAKYGTQITQDSERLFVEEFLYPLVGTKIENVLPQHPFLDRTGKSRRIDFAVHGSRAPLALEVNGETYHAEGIIPDAMFDENLFRQNEILRLGYRLARFSYSQLKDPRWRSVVMESLRDVISDAAPELLSEYALAPTELQIEALRALEFYRDTKGWRKAVIVMPTGTGKTILSALDVKRSGGKVLFLVHRLDILSQSLAAYRMVWPNLRSGYLTGEVRENETECDVLFASKDTLRQPSELARFKRNHFDYIVIDEVHHGQSPTYRDIIEYFRPRFMLGMTATPDRLDRKDIFELFDYNKAYEVPVSEVIERGFLVPYTYYGLTDDIDYSKIRYENNRYRVDDLEKHLIIPEHNQAILREYLAKGGGDKAIGFCVSIKHADRMTEVFVKNGIPAVSIHSQSPNRDALIQAFRENKIAVAFTVDLFNEGIDFPNVQVLLFLRPTESKTVFVQQLERGLRLAAGKERVRVLDFIGNYKRANLIRDYLAKNKKVTELEDGSGRKRRKIEYEYSTGCEVHFDRTVEEILNRQDREALGIGKIELEEAYYALAERLGRKPSRIDIDAQGEYKSFNYTRVFGSWLTFLREIGEYTEASYHYPQGTHVGHILAILWYFGLRSRKGTPFDDQYIRLRGGLGEGRLSIYRRQIKYKLQAAMELGLLEDDRRAPVTAFSEHAHIVASSEAGPRGRDAARPSDIHSPDNLMLLCAACHKLIDDHPTEYRRAVLEQYKLDHEDRIKHVTGLGPDMRTSVVQLKAAIGGSAVDIPAAHIYEAVAPRYPTDRKGHVIDLTSYGQENRDDYYRLATTKIAQDVGRLYVPGMDVEQTRHISLFALAPIPLLVYLGSRLSNKVSVEFYQRHRTGTAPWKWKTVGVLAQYHLRRRRSGTDPAKTALVPALSGTIDDQLLPEAIDDQFSLYEITLDGQAPNTDFLRQRRDLEEFRVLYRQFLSNLMHDHPAVRDLHLFPAIPAPIAVACGHDLLPKVHPSLVIYDYDKTSGGFIDRLRINDHEQ